MQLYLELVRQRYLASYKIRNTNLGLLGQLFYFHKIIISSRLYRTSQPVLSKRQCQIEHHDIIM